MKLSGIIQTLFFLALFLGFINGGIGWLLGYTLAAALAISFLLWIFSCAHYDVSLEEFSGVAEVGSECAVHIRLRKKGFCFLPLIALEGETPSGKFRAHASLMFKAESEAVISFCPRSCGLNKVALHQCVGEDMFGMFHGTKRVDMVSSVAVLPRRVDYMGPEVIPSFLPSESEEREEGATVAFGGTAGYEHREYAAGDSPRRINYKLSAKKRRLMVRMDESGGVESTDIILSDNADGDCAEQALALADRLVRLGGSSMVYHRGDSFGAALPASVEKLREWLAFRSFDGEYSSARSAPAGSACVVISPQGTVVKR